MLTPEALAAHEASVRHHEAEIAKLQAKLDAPVTEAVARVRAERLAMHEAALAAHKSLIETERTRK